MTEEFKEFLLTSTCNMTTLKFKSPDRPDRPESLTCDSCNNVNDLLLTELSDSARPRRSEPQHPPSPHLDFDWSQNFL